MFTCPEVKLAGEKMAQHLAHLQQELGSLRVGRASASLVENVMVESYGTRTPLKGVASITVPDAKTIMVQPWDKDLLVYVEKAINESDLGIKPTNTGIALRLAIPPMTEERRQELTKVVGKLAEETKIAMRNARQDIHAQVRAQKQKSEITEDDFYAIEKALNTEIEQHNKKVNELAAKKQAELMAV